jgi:hypothetical protein
MQRVGMSKRERLEREERAREWACKQRLREERSIIAEYARMNSDPVRAGEFLLMPTLVKLLQIQANMEAGCDPGPDIGRPEIPQRRKSLPTKVCYPFCRWREALAAPSQQDPLVDSGDRIAWREHGKSDI